MNKTYIGESELSNLTQLKSSIYSDLRVATFCIVTKVDTTKKMLNCKSVVKESINTKNGSEYVEVPEFLNVPYLIGSTPQVGDYCVCIHLDRSIKQFIANGLNNNSEVNSDNNRHNIGDCVALVGFLK